MEFFKSFLLSFGLWRRPRPIALEFSVLAKLPPELIIYVAEFLPPISATSFSLCCTQVYSLIAAQYLGTRRDNKGFDSFELLALLERDLPNHLACYYCRKFHEMKHAERYIYYFGNPCWIANLRLSVMWYIHWDFSFVVFQMVMKRHRQGADCSSLLDLLSWKERSYAYPRDFKRMTSLCRIVDGSLLVRSLLVFLVPPPTDVPFESSSRFNICPHFYSAGAKVSDQTGGFIEYELSSWNRWLAYWNRREIFHHRKGLVQCKFCATEFRVDLKYFDEVGHMILFTRWQNLGEGRSPLDHQWQSHLVGPGGPTWKRVYFPAGSICAAFEGAGETFEIDSLMTPEFREELFKNSWIL
jgi:hypothetical protein